MQTGINSLAKLPEIGAVYPFAGYEVIFAAAAALFFVLFIARQITMEAKHHKDIIGSFTASPAE